MKPVNKIKKIKTWFRREKYCVIHKLEKTSLTKIKTNEKVLNILKKNRFTGNYVCKKIVEEKQDRNQKYEEILNKI